MEQFSPAISNPPPRPAKSGESETKSETQRLLLYSQFLKRIVSLKFVAWLIILKNVRQFFADMFYFILN
jgi:hypothetical protein